MMWLGGYLVVGMLVVLSEILRSGIKWGFCMPPREELAVSSFLLTGAIMLWPVAVVDAIWTWKKNRKRYS